MFSYLLWRDCGVPNLHLSWIQDTKIPLYPNTLLQRELRICSHDSNGRKIKSREANYTEYSSQDSNGRETGSSEANYMEYRRNDSGCRKNEDSDSNGVERINYDSMSYGRVSLLLRLSSSWARTPTSVSPSPSGGIDSPRGLPPPGVFFLPSWAAIPPIWEKGFFDEFDTV